MSNIEVIEKQFVEAVKSGNNDAVLKSLHPDNDFEVDGFLDRMDKIVIKGMCFAIRERNYELFYTIWSNYVPMMSPDYVCLLLEPMTRDHNGKIVLKKIDDDGLLHQYGTSLKEVIEFTN